jgi:hypothetical protein
VYKIEHDGSVFRARFQHRGEFVEVKGRKAKKFNGQTLCIVERSIGEREWERVSEGSAVCSRKDVYDKATGRRYALDRATAGLGRDFRRAIFAQMFPHKPRA